LGTKVINAARELEVAIAPGLAVRLRPEVRTSAFVLGAQLPKVADLGYPRVRVLAADPTTRS
jgi:hypothetical protein